MANPINSMCKHPEVPPKHIDDIKMCPKGREYVESLVESGELCAYQCEKCLKQWLCDDPVENCINPEDTECWILQCTKPVDFWLSLIEGVLNNHKWVKDMESHQWYVKTMQALMKYIDTNNLVIKLVQK